MGPQVAGFGVSGLGFGVEGLGRDAKFGILAEKKALSPNLPKPKESIYMARLSMP